MTLEQKQVKDFMQFFGQETPEKPKQLDEETAKLRAKLILEEAFETITKGLGLSIGLAVKDIHDYEQVWIYDCNLKDIQVNFRKQKEVDLVELADGMADVHYVCYAGTAVATGIDMEPVFAEVHSSNMTKCWTDKDLEKAKELYPTAKVEYYGDGLYRLVREDGKIIKSPSYRPADIKSVLEAQSK